jgi:hypothetical protein
MPVSALSGHRIGTWTGESCNAAPPAISAAPVSRSSEPSNRIASAAGTGRETLTPTRAVSSARSLLLGRDQTEEQGLRGHLCAEPGHLSPEAIGELVGEELAGLRRQLMATRQE